MGRVPLLLGMVGAVAVGQGKALRAQMIMLAAACILFAPLLASGAGLFGVTATPSVPPLGVSVVVGVFLFGLVNPKPTDSIY